MGRVLPFVGLLVLSTLWAADQTDAARTIVPGRIPAATAPRAPKLGPPLSNPGSPVARLYRATPEERDRALEKLPAKMQEQFRTQLEHFDAMPKAQQEILIKRAERFAALTPGQRAIFIQQMEALRKLPEDRRREIGLALRRLQPLSQEDRQKFFETDDFKGKISPEEQKIITGLAEVMTPPN